MNAQILRMSHVKMVKRQARSASLWKESQDATQITTSQT